MNTFRSQTLRASLAFLALACGQPRSFAAETTAANWAVIQSVITEAPPAAQDEYIEWYFAQQAKIRELTLKFYEAHPSDPDRWLAANAYVQAKMFKDEDAAGRQAYVSKSLELVAAIVAGNDVPKSIQENASVALLAKECAAVTDPAALALLGEKFDAFVARFPKSAAMKELATQYFAALEKLNPLALVTGLDRYAESPSPAVAKIAERLRESKKYAEEAARRDAADLAALRASFPDGATLKFRAVDGRDVDLVKLRGKVVAVYFWATWCGWSELEHPNVLATLRQYGAQGFEVVGVTWDQADLKPSDTTSDRTAKLEKLKQNVRSYISEHEITWPNFVDSETGAEAFTRLFHVRGVPDIILLDRKGLVVAVGLRGTDLGAAIEKHLTE
jgi:thiol-disulfide isomerase/thioredoxin